MGLKLGLQVFKDDLWLSRRDFEKTVEKGKEFAR